MKRFALSLGMMVLAVGLLACGGAKETPTPTLPPPATLAVSEITPPPVEPARLPADVPLNLAAEPPPEVRGEPAPLLPPWPTFTPGPKPQSQHRLIYARTRRFYTASADGSDIQQLKFENRAPQLLASYYKDPGRGWLSPDGRYLVYIAGKEAQLWRADLQSLDNVQLAERMMPLGQTVDKETIRLLINQEMGWTSDSRRVALLGAPSSVDLFVADLTTDQLTRITQDELLEERPQWSPDGRYLVYAATDPATGTQDLFVWDAQVQQSIQVDVDPVRSELDLDAGARFVFAYRFAWVNDREFIFYPQLVRRAAGIWVYNVADGEMRPVFTDRLEDLAWSDEARAWVYSTPDAPGTLWLLRLDDPKPVSLVEGDAYAPIWSPDGKSVLYSWGGPDATEWDLRVIDLSGNDRTLAEGVALIQPAPPEPGPAGKRFWSPDSRLVLYTAIGRDYGRAEREEGYGGEAGPDLENWWMVSVEGGQPWQATDMQKVFYVQAPVLSPDGTAWAYIAFSYTDRLQHLFTIPREGGHPKKVDVGVRWFQWLP